MKPDQNLKLVVTDSSDTQIVEMTGEPDLTVRPATGKLLELGLEWQAKYQAWLKEKQEQQANPPPADPNLLAEPK